MARASAQWTATKVHIMTVEAVTKTHIRGHTQKNVLRIEKYFKYLPTLNIFCTQQILKTPSTDFLLPTLIETGPQQIHSKCIYFTSYITCVHTNISKKEVSVRNLQPKFQPAKYPSPNCPFILLHKVS